MKASSIGICRTFHCFRNHPSIHPYVERIEGGPRCPTRDAVRVLGSTLRDLVSWMDFYSRECNHEIYLMDLKPWDASSSSPSSWKVSARLIAPNTREQ